MRKIRLDKYEQTMINSYDKNEWKSVKNVKQTIKSHIEYARNTQKKNRRVNIRISTKDLENIQVIAIQEGLPYQTLIASIIHKFAAGQYIDKNQITSQST